MSADVLFRAFGGVREEYLEAAAKSMRTSKSQRRIKRVLRWSSAAACFVLIVALAAWLFLPPTGTFAAASTHVIFPFGEWYADYREVDEMHMSRFDTFMLSVKIGKFYQMYGESELYKIKGSDNISSLIRKLPDGSLSLFHFEKFFNFDFDEITQKYSFEDVLELIYGVTSAEDIKSVKFSKNDNLNDGVGKKVKITPVTLTDSESLESFFEIMKSAEPVSPPLGKRIYPTDLEYLNGELPLAVQTDREITVTLFSGEKLIFIFDAQSKCLHWNEMIRWLNEEDAVWLISIAGIDMEYRDYGTEAVKYGSETANPGDITASNLPH